MAHIPYGYKIENGKAEIDEYKAIQVRDIYKYYLSGLSYMAAAEAAGLKLKHAGAKKMIQNTYYLGDDYYPSIIDKETFDAAEAERVKRQVKMGRVFDTKPMEEKKIEANFIIPKFEIKYTDPYKQAEYVYGLIESRVEK